MKRNDIYSQKSNKLDNILNYDTNKNSFYSIKIKIFFLEIKMEEDLLNIYVKVTIFFCTLPFDFEGYEIKDIYLYI